MKISYAIPVCNEHVELEKLLLFLVKHIDENDEIVVQCDRGNTTSEVYKTLDSFKAPVGLKDPLKIIEFPLNRDFASFKNNLKNHCTGDWIFQIDADELPHESLITNLKSLLKLNSTTEMFMVPRVNTVGGLTQEHINKWHWNVNEEGWVNWPDYQTRIIQNSPKIKWQNKVHEQIVGISTKGALPMEEEWCLYHPKDIKRQEAQNNFYDSL
jgi:glycosyltransferase involved in cell wall biosynthesis